ncbi:MAG: metallophosphoesterase family protein [Moorellaceae bacterium]
MLFLCVADLHGGPFQPPAFTGRPNAVLLLGDLEWSVEKVVKMFPDVPLFGVPGNHDPRIDPFYGIPAVNLHGRVVEFRGLRIGGLGGCLRYKSGDGFLFWDAEYGEILKKMPAVDVFVSHCPPAGIPWCDPPAGGTGWHGARQLLPTKVGSMQAPAVIFHFSGGPVFSNRQAGFSSPRATRCHKGYS